MASNLMSEERKPPDTDSEEDGKCSIFITFLKFIRFSESFYQYVEACSS